MYYQSDSLAKFPRRTSSSSGLTNQAQVSDGQQQQQQQQQSSVGQHSNNNQSSVQASAVQLTASSGVTNVSNTGNQPSTSNSASTIVGLLHQNSMNSRQQNSMANASNSYGGSSVQAPSPGSSSTIPPTQPNPSTFQPPTPSSSNNLSQSSHTTKNANQMSAANSPANISMQQPALSGDADPSDTQSSVQKILQEMMMNNQMNGPTSLVGVGSVVNDMKNVNGVLPTNNAVLNNGNCLGGNGTTNGGSGMGGGGGYGSMGNGHGQPAMVNGMRNAMGNNSIMNRRIGMASLALEQSMNGQQQDLGNQLLSGLGAVNGFSNLQFDWKPSP